MAREAMWQTDASTRGHLRGTEVTGPRECTRMPGWRPHGSVRGWQVMGPQVSGRRLDN